MKDRDCKTCAWSYGDGCSAWDCNYINALEAIRAYKAIPSLTSLYISDGGHIRRIGENHHDMLIITEDNKLHYQNLQNGDGCELGRKSEWYNFVPNTDDHGYNYDPTKTDKEYNPLPDCPWK